MNYKAIIGLALLANTSFAQLDNLLTPVGDQGAIEATGRTASRAKAASFVLGAEPFVAQLEKELSERLKLTGDLKLALAQPWKELKLPAADFAIVVMETPASGIAGTFTVRTKVMSGGETVAEIQVALRAQLWQEVWTAASRLERGQALDRSLLGTARVDSLRETQPPLLAEVDPASLEVAQNISASRPLTRRDVIARPLIRKGRVVEVIAQQGQMAISMKALALESGASGDLIKLRNIESRKEFSGQILNENKVEVHF